MILNDINVIGKGSFGCVYEGELPNKEKKLIKISTDESDWENEVKLLKKIKAILEPNSSITNESEERIILSDKNDYMKVFKKCKIKKYNKLEKIYQIIYNYSKKGVSIYDFDGYFDVIKLSKDLYHTLYIYKQFNLIHNDITPANIIYLKKVHKLFFIDFGFSVDYTNVVIDNIYTRKTSFSNIPEKLLYKYKKSVNDFIYDFIYEFKKNHSYVLAFYPIEIMEFDLWNLYNNYHHNIHEYEYKENIAKIDVFLLSLTLLNTYYRINNQIYKNDKFINDILIPSIRFNVKERISIEEICKRIFLL
jgi:serine/threonine protein kinase